MDFKQLFDDDRAVSPVIGVILMVAITVILAAVIGTFVLGLGDQVQSTTPQASFGFGSTNLSDGTAGNDEVTITHESGDTIQTGSLVVKIGNTNVFDQGTLASGASGWSGDSVSAGSQLTFSEVDAGSNTFTGENTIRVIYDSPDSDSTATLGTSTYTFD